MLPLGRKNARRCTECQITCHASCAHLVPDLCGMPMEVANELLRNWKEINRGKQQPRSRTHTHEDPDSLTSRVDTLALEPMREMRRDAGYGDGSRFEEIPASPSRMQRPPDFMDGSPGQHTQQQQWETRELFNAMVRIQTT
jgi:hypothetical protein